MKHAILFCLLLTVAAGCRSTRLAESPGGPSFRVLTYNVNWGRPRPDLAAEIIRQSGAQIVCLQETTPEWERFLRSALREEFGFAEFRNSEYRMGGGLAFLSKVPAREVAYVPSDSGWFDGWIMAFDTAAGPMQVLNVHLRPRVSDSGSWVRGYLTTGDERLREVKRFYGRRATELPMLVVGDFNDTVDSRVLRWLEQQSLSNALPEFDRNTPSWQWRYHGITLSRRMDHVVYSQTLHCCSAQVVYAGGSDHFPVTAVFAKANATN